MQHDEIPRVGLMPPQKDVPESSQAQGLQRVAQNREPLLVEKKIGRNEPCPCSSGKKYKKCCGMST